MTLHESFDARQARQNAHLEAVIAAAVAGTHHTIKPVAATVAPRTVAASSIPASSPALPMPVARATRTPDVVGAPQPGMIGFGWDAVVASLNIHIAAQGGVAPGHLQASEIAPALARATIEDLHGWGAVVDRLNDGMLRSSTHQRAPGASSWDDVIDRLNAENFLGRIEAADARNDIRRN